MLKSLAGHIALYLHRVAGRLAVYSLAGRDIGVPDRVTVMPEVACADPLSIAQDATPLPVAKYARYRAFDGCAGKHRADRWQRRARSRFEVARVRSDSPAQPAGGRE
jgi:hypothetical protein